MFKSLTRLSNLTRINNFKYSTNVPQNNLNLKKEPPVIIKPFEHPDFFDVKKLVDLNELFK